MLNTRRFNVMGALAIVFLWAGVSLGAHILMLSAMEDQWQESDDLLIAYLEGLGHTVTVLDDNENLETTQAAALDPNVDLVFISESSGSGNIQNELTPLEVPIVSTEGWAYYEMGLTAGDSSFGEGLEVVTPDIEIVNPGHPLAAGLEGTVTIFKELTGVLGDLRLTKGQAGDEATVIAQATLSDGLTYDTIWYYEKGAELPNPPADGSPRVAADLRVCFGFEGNGYLQWTEEAFFLFEAAINFGLGVRIQPEAYSPSPANGQQEVQRHPMLGWRGGVFAETHNVYFGTDFNDVNEASVDDPRGVLVSQNQTDRTYDPGMLEYDQTYYWRVDEVNAAPDNAIYKGGVWSFQILNFLVVDDMEGYDDIEPNRIFDTWIDGFNDAGNGSQVGYLNPTFVETAAVHSGEQSMPLSYDNQMKIAEAHLPLSGDDSDWTRGGVDTLSLWFMGNPEFLADFTESNGTFTIKGAGADIWANADQFHFAYKELTGSIEIIARVDSLENTDPFAKAGVMVRDTLEANARNVGVFVTPENGIRYQFRDQTDGGTDREFDPNQTAPHWVRIERTTGGLVRAYHSEDGSDWTQFGIRVAQLDSPWYVGLAVTSHSPGVATEAVFSNVTITGNGSEQPWMNQDVGLLSNSPDRIFVALNDSDAVYYESTDPNAPSATVMDTWTEWRIPLQNFADLGVDLGSITKMTLGVGTQGDTSGDGGTGLLYFDDVRLYRP